MFIGLVAFGGALYMLSQRRSDMKQAELVTRLTATAAAVAAIGTEVSKIGEETSSLSEQIATLREELTDVDLSDDAEAALTALETGVSNVAASVQAVDDLVPDATPPVVAPADPSNPDAPSGVVEGSGDTGAQDVGTQSPPETGGAADTSLS
jgi:uncharacterized protein YqgV (UPF0045/DUF77 family)